MRVIIRKHKLHMQQQIQHWNNFTLVRTGFSLAKDEQTCEAYTLDIIYVVNVHKHVRETHVRVIHSRNASS
jgi:hypothetical protein